MPAMLRKPHVNVLVERMRQPQPTDVEWRLTAATQFKFFELTQAISEVDPSSDDAEALREAIRSLPGFPKNYLPEVNHIVLVVTDVQH